MAKPKLQLTAPQYLATSFLLVILLGTLLLSLPWASSTGKSNFLTALFTATSATCVTGLAVVDTATYWSLFGKVVILLLVQVGGLGIMSFAVFYALILGKKIQLRQRLMMQQAVNKIDPGGVVKLFRNLLLFTFLSEALGAIILAVHWTGSLGWKKALWFGLFHAITAFNNGSFDLWGGNKSLTGFVGDPTVNLVIGALIIIGGLGFVVVNEISNHKKGQMLSIHTRIVLYTTLALIVGGTLILLLSEYTHALAGMPWMTKVLASFFQSVTSRTAGFNTLDLGTLLPSSQLMIIVLMFIGGSPGSTAGGIKTTTITLLLAAVYSMVRGRKDTEIMEHRIAFEDLVRALTVVAMYAFIVLLVTFLLMLTHNESFMTVLFEVCSAIGTVGLSLGLTSKLTAFGQMLIILTMFLGRIGPLTLAFALAYKGNRADYRYPPGKVMIG
ncbi:MAG TPA: TrkH family potassium uptake protein [Syntrophomonadaceae bacterium]|nr:TrkH family potassium uptake protein [Syntrophomonadaceae bacterium]